jgi:hypothetical protein
MALISAHAPGKKMVYRTNAPIPEDVQTITAAHIEMAYIIDFVCNF